MQVSLYGSISCIAIVTRLWPRFAFSPGGPMLGLGPFEMILVFAVLLLLFGAKRLPELASGMGKGIRDFKRSLNGLDEQSVQNSQQQQSYLAQTPPPPPAVPPTPPAEEPKRLG
jgi:sec-independent protein translocase protein TatA